MADPDSTNLEDAKRRARRRLVGAAVLALIAAVVLPMFLESDPKPLGTDVQIRIPAIDDSKFRNRLTPGALAGNSDGPSSAAAEAGKPAASGAGASTATPTEQATAGSGAAAKTPEAVASSTGAPIAGAAPRSGDPSGSSPAPAALPPESAGTQESPKAVASKASQTPAAAPKVPGPAQAVTKAVEPVPAAPKAAATTPLTAAAPEPAPKAPPPVAAAPAATKASVPASGPAPAHASVPASAPGPVPASATKPPAAVPAQAAPDAAPVPATASGANNLVGIQTITPQSAATMPAGEFVVQLGAFADVAVAQDLATRAGAQGYHAYLEPVTTKAGSVQRVRIGPFMTREAADAAASRMKAAGFTAVARPR